MAKTTPIALTRKEAVREAIMACTDADGTISARAVFEAAKNPNSPLHGEFIWDGATAIEELGLQTAARLIRTVRVEVVVDSRRVVAPYFVNSPKQSEPGAYLPLASVRDDETIKRGVLLEEISRIESAIRRARGISGFLEIEDEFDDLLKTTTSIRSRVGK